MNQTFSAATTATMPSTNIFSAEYVVVNRSHHQSLQSIFCHQYQNHYWSQNGRIRNSRLVITFKHISYKYSHHNTQRTKSQPTPLDSIPVLIYKTQSNTNINQNSSTITPIDTNNFYNSYSHTFDCYAWQTRRSPCLTWHQPVADLHNSHMYQTNQLTSNSFSHVNAIK